MSQKSLRDARRSRAQLVQRLIIAELLAPRGQGPLAPRAQLVPRADAPLTREPVRENEP